MKVTLERCVRGGSLSSCYCSWGCVSSSYGYIWLVHTDAVSQVEQASLKEAASALAKLLLEAARTDVDAAGIGSVNACLVLTRCAVWLMSVWLPCYIQAGQLNSESAFKTKSQLRLLCPAKTVTVQSLIVLLSGAHELPMATLGGSCAAAATVQSRQPRQSSVFAIIVIVVAANGFKLLSLEIAQK